MKIDTLSKEEGSHEDVNVQISSPFGVPAKDGAGVLEETRSSSAGVGIAFQLSKEKFIEAAEACYGKLYPTEINDTIEAPDIGKIIYNLPLKKLEFDFLPTSPRKLRRYKNAIKMTGSASGEMRHPDLKFKRVFFKVYAVAEPKISSDFVYLQFKQFGIEDFAPSGRGLSRQVINRIQATLDPLFNRQIKKKIKKIKLGPTVLPIDEEGLLKARIGVAKVKESALSFYAIPAGQETEDGFEISPEGDEIHISETFLNDHIARLRDSGRIDSSFTVGTVEDYEIGDVEVTRIRLDAEVNSLSLTGRIKFKLGSAQKSYDFTAPVTVSVNPATSELTCDAGEPKLKDVKKDLPRAVVEAIIAAFALFLPGVVITVIRILYEIYQMILITLKEIAEEIIEELEFPSGTLIFPVPIPDTNRVYVFHCTEIEIGKDEIILRGWSEIIEVR